MPADRFMFRISSLQIGDAAPFGIASPGVLAVVGGNNVGKSTLLRQIEAASKSDSMAPPRTPRVLTEIEIQTEGTAKDLRDWGAANGLLHEVHGGECFGRTNAILSPENVWRRLQDGDMQYSNGAFITRPEVSERVTRTEPVAPRDDLASPPSHPTHVLTEDRVLLQRIRYFVNRLFGMELTLDRLSGRQGFRVGRVTVDAPRLDEAAGRYGEELKQLPWLSDQGDGVKSAVGVLLSLAVNPSPVVLLDEPEAFLHPPQARELGRQIAELAHLQSLQVIVATHDHNLLLGLVEYTKSAVSVLHLKRSGDETTASMLPADVVRAIWSEPTMRYGNALEALFHRAAVLVEDERDAVFYQASVDALIEAESLTRQPNLFFLATSGKQGMPKVVERMRAMEVTVVSSPDLDLLADTGDVKRLLAAHGGTWEEYRADYLAVVKEFQTAKSAPTRAYVRQNFDVVIPPTGGSKLTAEEVSRGRELFSTVNPWEQVKRYGRAALTADRAAAGRLLDYFQDHGVVCAEVGELENFLKTRTVQKGPAWLAAALEDEAYASDDALRHARSLLKAAGIDLDELRGPARSELASEDMDRSGAECSEDLSR